MDERTKIAVELAKAYLTNDPYSMDNTEEIMVSAVEDTDNLLKWLARPPGTVTLDKFRDGELDPPEKKVKVTEVSEEKPKRSGFFGLS